MSIKAVEVLKRVDKSFESGKSLGVSGTLFSLLMARKFLGCCLMQSLRRL